MGLTGTSHPADSAGNLAGLPGVKTDGQMTKQS